MQCPWDTRARLHVKLMTTACTLAVKSLHVRWLLVLTLVVAFFHPPFLSSMHPVPQALREFHRMLHTVARQYCHVRTLCRQLAHLSPALKAADSEWFSFAEFRWAVSVSAETRTLHGSVCLFST